jgi:hypothetical protein
MKPLTHEEQVARFKFDQKQAEKDFKRYVKSFSKCFDPPPCLGCALRDWAYCAETGYCCFEFEKYIDDPKAEKGE